MFDIPRMTEQMRDALTPGWRERPPPPPSVALCEDCFTPDEGVERLTGPQLLPCVACGRYDGRHLSGPVVRTYRRDPRPRP